jgi:hypothetical protein
MYLVACWVLWDVGDAVVSGSMVDTVGKDRPLHLLYLAVCWVLREEIGYWLLDYSGNGESCILRESLWHIHAGTGSPRFIREVSHQYEYDDDNEHVIDYFSNNGSGKCPHIEANQQDHVRSERHELV